MQQLTKEDARRIKRRNFTSAAISFVLCLFEFYLATLQRDNKILAIFFIILGVFLGIQANISFGVAIDFRRAEKQL